MLSCKCYHKNAPTQVPTQVMWIGAWMQIISKYALAICTRSICWLTSLPRCQIWILQNYSWYKNSEPNLTIIEWQNEKNNTTFILKTKKVFCIKVVSIFTFDVFFMPKSSVEKCWLWGLCDPPVLIKMTWDQASGGHFDELYHQLRSLANLF